MSWKSLFVLWRQGNVIQKPGMNKSHQLYELVFAYCISRKFPLVLIDFLLFWLYCILKVCSLVNFWMKWKKVSEDFKDFQFVARNLIWGIKPLFSFHNTFWTIWNWFRSNKLSLSFIPMVLRPFPLNCHRKLCVAKYHVNPGHKFITVPPIARNDGEGKYSICAKPSNKKSMIICVKFIVDRDLICHLR